MNALEMARTAYASAAAPIRTERGSEYEAFARITSDLKQAIVRRKTDFNGFVTALHRNRQLWNILAATVADRRNELDPELRARIFYLAEFTQLHSSKVLSKKADPVILLEINAAVMRGLRAGDAAPPPPGSER